MERATGAPCDCQILQLQRASRRMNCCTHRTRRRRGDPSLGEFEQIDEDVRSQGNIIAIGTIGLRLAGNPPDISRLHHLDSRSAEPPNRATRLKIRQVAMLPPARNKDFGPSEPSGGSVLERDRRPICPNRLKDNMSGAHPAHAGQRD